MISQVVVTYVGVVVCVVMTVLAAMLCVILFKIASDAWMDYKKAKKRLEDEVWNRLNQ